MRVLWTDAATRSVQIATFPFSGRMVPEYELNEIREVLEGSYRIIYLIKDPDKQVEVLAIIHTARQPTESPRVTGGHEPLVPPVS